MNIQHDCLLPELELNETILSVRRRWVCPECGQYWIIKYWSGSISAERTIASGLKNWWWQRKMRKELT